MLEFVLTLGAAHCTVPRLQTHGGSRCDRFHVGQRAHYTNGTYSLPYGGLGKNAPSIWNCRMLNSKNCTEARRTRWRCLQNRNERSGGAAAQE